MAYQISRWGREEAIELSRKFGLNEAAMIEARRLLEEQQAATGKQMDAWIRAAAGYGPAAEPDAQPEGDQAPPKRLPTANAGDGAASTGYGRPPSMSDRIRDAVYGRAPKTWTENG